MQKVLEILLEIELLTLQNRMLVVRLSVEHFKTSSAISFTIGGRGLIYIPKSRHLYDWIRA